MSRYSGPAGKGAQRRTRTEKREAAEERTARTPLERRRRFRGGDPETRLLMSIFGRTS